MSNLIGLIIRSYRSDFSINWNRIDFYSDWKIQSIKAEVLCGKIYFYAVCKKVKEHVYGKDYDYIEDDCPFCPYMDIELHADGVPDGYKIIRKNERL